MTTGTRHAIARDIAWAAFWVLIAALLAVVVFPLNTFSLTAWTITVIVALVIGTAARIYLWKTGGEMFPDRKEGRRQ